MDLKQKNTKQPKKTKEPGQRKLSNLLALDFAHSGVKAVRLKKVKGRIVLSAADILPPVNLDAGERPNLPKSLGAYYTSVCVSPKEAHLRVFGCVLEDGVQMEEVVRDNLSVSEDFRVAGRTFIWLKFCQQGKKI